MSKTIACREYPRRAPISKLKFQPHQEFVVDYFLKSKYKGILLFHKLGSGKTCTAIHFVDRLKVMTGKMPFVYVITPGALRNNFIAEYCAFCGKNRIDFDRYFIFLSYNYSGIMSQLPEIIPKGSVVIVDEVQGIINGVRNESKTLVAIYDLINRSSGIKVLLLSGTPLNQSSIELNIYLELLKPNSGVNIGAITVSAEEGEVTWYNEDLFYRQMEGIISYVGFSDIDNYPKTIYMEPYEIPMSQHQHIHYLRKEIRDLPALIQLDKERRALLRKIRGLSKTGKEMRGILMKYDSLNKKAENPIFMIGARQVCNIAYPDKLEQDIALKGQKNVAPDRLRPNGWISFLIIKELKEKYSPKMFLLLKNIIDNIMDGKHLVYSFFLHRHGTMFIRAILNNCGIPNVIYSGETSEKVKEEYIEMFNDKGNMEGNKIKVFIVTGAGTRGITLLEVRHVHIVEPSFRECDIQQVIGRAVRYRSHFRLPPDKRNVTIHRYHSTIPDGKRRSIDQIIYERGTNRWKSITAIMDLMKSAAIDKDMEWAQ